MCALLQKKNDWQTQHLKSVLHSSMINKNEHIDIHVIRRKETIGCQENDVNEYVVLPGTHISAKRMPSNYCQLIICIQLTLPKSNPFGLKK